MLLPLLAFAALNTGGDLLVACTQDPAGKTACSAMVLGVANGAMLAQAETGQKALCPHIGQSPRDLVAAVIRYLEAHPEDRSRPAFLLTYRALKDAMPCTAP